MSLGCRAQTEQDVVANKHINAVKAGHREQANCGKESTVMRQDVFEDLTGIWQFLGHEADVMDRKWKVFGFVFNGITRSSKFSAACYHSRFMYDQFKTK